MARQRKAVSAQLQRIQALLVDIERCVQRLGSWPEANRNPAEYQRAFQSVYLSVHYRVGSLGRWFSRNVVGFTPLDKDDQRSYANEISLWLVTGTCPCHLRHCAVEHRVAAFSTSNTCLDDFIWRAVEGPTCTRMANSLCQGMFWFEASFDHDLKCVWAEFKECDNCGSLYEGDACVEGDCGARFDESRTLVIPVRWLVIEGAYLPAHRWRCGEGRHRHLYPQRICVSIKVSDYPEPVFNVKHGSTHDRCPLREKCPAGHPERHPLTGFTVWIRGEFGPEEAGRLAVLRTPPPGLVGTMKQAIVRVFEEATEQQLQWLRSEIDRKMEKALKSLSADLTAEALEALLQQWKDDPMMIAEILMEDAKARDKAQENIVGIVRKTLEENGIDAEAFTLWQRKLELRAQEREVIGHEDDPND